MMPPEDEEGWGEKLLQAAFRTTRIRTAMRPESAAIRGLFGILFGESSFSNRTGDC